MDVSDCVSAFDGLPSRDVLVMLNQPSEYRVDRCLVRGVAKLPADKVAGSHMLVGSEKMHIADV